jgi:hypothetical protein
MSDFNSQDFYFSFLNLDHRKDRLNHMTNELNRVGITAERTRGKLPNEYDLLDPKLQAMRYRTPGAIPCHYGQVSIIKEAFNRGKSAFVMEDDLTFCSDLRERMDYFQNFLNRQEDWAIAWLGGTYSINPPWWHKIGHNSELTQCKCTLGKDAECTDDPRIMRTFGCFSTFCYMVNYRWIEKILEMLEENIHFSIGIDFLFIYLQPRIKTYAFAPGLVKQIDNKSDIGNGITYFTSFLKLNGTLDNSAYVYQDKMDSFNPATFDWAEAKTLSL